MRSEGSFIVRAECTPGRHDKPTAGQSCNAKTMGPHQPAVLIETSNCRVERLGVDQGSNHQ